MVGSIFRYTGVITKLPFVIPWALYYMVDISALFRPLYVGDGDKREETGRELKIMMGSFIYM